MLLPQIPSQEFPERLERLRALMNQDRLKAVLLGTGSNLRYFSGYPSPARSGPRPFFLVLPLAGDPIFIVQAGRKAEALRFSCIKDVRDYSELSRIPVRMIQEALQERGALRGRVGMELGYEQFFDVPYLEFRRLEEALSGTMIVDAGSLLWRLRMIKSEAEIACLRSACRILSEAYRSAFTAARMGASEKDVAESLRCYCRNAGTDEEWVLAVSGRGNYGLATKTPDARTISKGEMIWIDAGCSVCGYWSDFSRAAVVSGPTPEQIRAQETIHRITWEAVRRIRPGVRASEIARVCDNGIGQLDFPIIASISGQASRAGHGLGLGMTEPPHVAKYDDTMLEPGMVITIEPGVATEYGTFHVEEDVVVVKDGCEVLSEAQRDLWIISPE